MASLASRTVNALARALKSAQEAEAVQAVKNPVVEVSLEKMDALFSDLELLANSGKEITEKFRTAHFQDKEAQEYLRDHIDDLADISTKVFNAWVYLLDPIELRRALEDISEKDLARVFVGAPEIAKKVQLAIAESE